MSKENICKWAEISRVRHDTQYDFLSKKLNDMGFHNQVDYFDFPTSEFDERIEEIKQNYEQIRIGSPYGEILALK